MRLTYAMFRGYKRHHLARIKEMEVEFTRPVTIITGPNGYSKSSTLMELGCFPAVRTAYDPDGRKELHVEHDGHLFKLISDFSSKISPHSFIMDGVELNTGHTTDIQEELLIKHFGLTVPIRNLIYYKLKMCSLTRTERKNLFLNINPLDLSLILTIHKAALAKFKDCRANLQLLNTRKVELESKLMDPQVLNQHVKTKQELNDLILEIDKVVYNLSQHIAGLKERYSDELSYHRSCIDNNHQLIPAQEILSECKNIIKHATKYREVARGDEFITKRSELKMKQLQTDDKINEIRNTVASLSKEINEYQEHIDQDHGRTVSTVEKELGDIETELKNYSNLPDEVIPVNLRSHYNEAANELREVLFIFRDSEIKMIAPTQIHSWEQQADQLRYQATSINTKLANLQVVMQEQLADLEANKSKAAIPTDCKHPDCGLKVLFEQRQRRIDELYQSNLIQEKAYKQQLEELQKQLQEVAAKVSPYQDGKLVYHFDHVQSILREIPYFHPATNTEELIRLLNTQPMSIYTDLIKLLEDSAKHDSYEALLKQKNILTAELNALAKSSGISKDFLQKKLAEKEHQVKEYLAKLTTLEHTQKEISDTYNLYLEYAAATNKVEEFQRTYSRGEKALIVYQAIRYWTKLSDKFLEAKSRLSEELRSLDILVRDQEVLRRSYNSETINLLKQVTEDKDLFERIEMALSPNSGIPFKSMVKYLNALINNANYFLSQLWNYKLKLTNIDNDRALDYNFRIEVGNELASDINVLSEGQAEVVNLVWVLTILLQLKQLDQIPLYLDEGGRALDASHRAKLLSFLSKLIETNHIKQLFMVSHYEEFIHGFPDSDIIYLNPGDMSEAPQGANEHARFVLF